MGAVASSNLENTGSTQHPTQDTDNDFKTLRQRDLYHNPDPLGQLVGEANESKVIVEG